MKKMGKILPVEAVVGAAMLKNKGWLRGRICFENEVVYTGVEKVIFVENYGVSSFKLWSSLWSRCKQIISKIRLFSLLYPSRFHLHHQRNKQLVLKGIKKKEMKAVQPVQRARVQHQGSQVPGCSQNQDAGIEIQILEMKKNYSSGPWNFSHLK